ncbi:MAG: GNAT family N-acetyltransferase [Gammaproteobacteria bacterium]|nr:MAG: GNAT family N-acetyltransferase [Gammaproteobacteria bacterium]
MSVIVSTAFLFNTEAGKPERAELWDAITEQQLADWEGEWVPEMLKALQRLHRAGVPRKLWPQSRHWDWRQKTASLQGLLAHPGFSVVCGGVTQGMMILDTTTKRCRVEAHRGKNLVYVRYLENAPWNQKELFDPPRYRGVGSILVRAAIELSRSEGFRGRIGLHALPQSNAFYAKTCAMSDFGVDTDPNYSPMRYFEMTPEQAEAFIAKGIQP